MKGFAYTLRTVTVRPILSRTENVKGPNSRLGNRRTASNQSPLRGRNMSNIRKKRQRKTVVRMLLFSLF